MLNAFLGINFSKLFNDALKDEAKKTLFLNALSDLSTFFDSIKIEAELTTLPTSIEKGQIDPIPLFQIKHRAFQVTQERVNQLKELAATYSSEIATLGIKNKIDTIITNEKYLNKALAML